MNEGRTSALLVGRGLMNSPRLIKKLHAQQWKCHFAGSYQEAHAHLNAGCFELLLSEFHLPDGSASRLIPWLEGSQTTVYFSIQTGTVTWWLPAVDHGLPCFGAAALRAEEFGWRLEESLQEMIWPAERDSFASAQAIDSFRTSVSVPLDFPGRPRPSGRKENLLSIRRKAG